MDARLLLVEFSRELDAAEAPVIQAEALFRQQEPAIFQAEAPVGCPKPWDLGVESAESASIFLARVYKVRGGLSKRTCISGTYRHTE